MLPLSRKSSINVDNLCGQRYISFIPTIAFPATLQSSWEALSVSFQAGLVNGGPTALVWGILLCIIGSTSIAASLGEMASMSASLPAIRESDMTDTLQERPWLVPSIAGPLSMRRKGLVHQHFGAYCKERSISRIKLLDLFTDAFQAGSPSLHGWQFAHKSVS